MYFLSGEATCLKVMPACLVMSVNAILMGCWLKTGFSRKDAKAQRRMRRIKILCGFLCAFASLREKKLFIGLSIAPCLLTLSTSRAACRPRLCARRRRTHDRVDNEHAPDRAGGARQSRGFRCCP